MSKNSNPNQSAGCAAFPASLTAKELSSQFVQVKKQTRKYNGENDCLDALAYASGVLSVNREDFTQSKFLSLTRGHVDHADSTSTLLGLFADWVNFLIQNKKLIREFVIDAPTYRWIG